MMGRGCGLGFEIGICMLRYFETAYLGDGREGTFDFEFEL